MLALLPVRPKRASKNAVEEEKQSALETIQAVLRMILKDLERLGKEGMKITCPDGVIRYGHPVLAGWLADYPEYIKLFAAKYNSCPVCVAPTDKMDAHPTQPISYRKVDNSRIQFLLDVHKAWTTVKETEKRTSPLYEKAVQHLATIEFEFSSNNLRMVDNFLWTLPHVTPGSLWKPDLLHTMDLGMIKHALDWMFNMLDDFGNKALGDLFDITWMAVTHHPAIIIPTKKYRAVKQWSGKEYRNAALLMVGVLDACIMPFPVDGEVLEAFERALDCLTALVDFYLLVNDRSHTFPEGQEFNKTYRSKWTGDVHPDQRDTIS